MSNRGRGDDSSQDETFDTNLPTEHSYLGNMDHLQGYTLFDDYSVLDMLGLYADTWVCPGYTLPLYIEYSLEVDLMKRNMERTNTFVLLCSRREEEEQTGYGITMQIIEYSEKDNVLALKAKGRQRCLVQKISSFDTFRMAKITIKILPDIELASPLLDAQIASLNKKRLYITDHSTLRQNWKYRRYDAAQLRFPLWVYDQYEAHILTEKIHKLLDDYSTGNLAPRDPVKLSYWFMQNFQLNNDERLNILKLDSNIQRLQLELEYIQKKRLLCCSFCNTVIANQKDIFAMSKDGIQSNYCNPGGHVYETLTVSEACRISLIGRPSDQFSWFPGYSWTIAQCAQCNHHLGWLFTSRKLRPHKFWGLAKNCIKAKIINDAATEQL